MHCGWLAQRLDEPGLHFILDNTAPWLSVVRVSRRLKGTQLRDIEVHDVAGTELGVDVSVEWRDLHDLVLLRPGHTVAFLGFDAGEFSAKEAPMLDISAAGHG